MHLNKYFFKTFQYFKYLNKYSEIKIYLPETQLSMQFGSEKNVFHLNEVYFFLHWHINLIFTYVMRHMSHCLSVCHGHICTGKQVKNC